MFAKDESLENIGKCSLYLERVELSDIGGVEHDGLSPTGVLGRLQSYFHLVDVPVGLSECIRCQCLLY